MKTIRIADLKAHLSQTLRAVRGGERILVLDRDQPVAEIGPVRPGSETALERLSQEGRIRLGSQDWSSLTFSPTSRRVAIQDILRQVREDPD
jgi:antitoxin (DNA-binding transcriptional repressor) of toxin-antitoxin stability system